jgi:hypothetical protein
VRVQPALARWVKAVAVVVVVAVATFFLAGNVSGTARTAAVLVGVAAAIAGVVLSWRIALVFDDDEIVVRNLFLTHRLRWDQLDAVSSRRLVTLYGYSRNPRVVRFVPRGGARGTAAQATRAMGSRAGAVFEALREQAERHGIRYEITPPEEQSMS